MYNPKLQKETDELLHKVDRTPAEEREFAEIMAAEMTADAKRFAQVAPDEARALRAKVWELRGQLRLTGTIIPITRIRRILRMPRARARRTAPSTAARAADSGGSGSGDPDPEPHAPFDFAHLANLLNYPSTLVASQAMPGVCS